MRSTVNNLLAYVAIVCSALAFTHVARYYDAVAWPFAAMFALIAAVAGICTVYQELDSMKLPKIAALDLHQVVVERRQRRALEWLLGARPVSGSDPDFDYERGELKPRSLNAAALEPFPDGWWASS